VTAALVLFLAAALIPAFFGRVSSAPFWLALQALALAGVALTERGVSEGHAIAAALEMAILRGALAPLLLNRALRTRSEPDSDLLPSNLFAWSAAVAIMALAFQFGAPVISAEDAVTLGSVGVGVAVSFLLLATGRTAPVQLVALLYMENTIALFESLLAHPWPLPVHAALATIYLLTVAVGTWLIGKPDPARDSRGYVAAVRERIR